MLKKSNNLNEMFKDYLNTLTDYQVLLAKLRWAKKRWPYDRTTLQPFESLNIRPYSCKSCWGVGKYLFLSICPTRKVGFNV